MTDTCLLCVADLDEQELFFTPCTCSLRVCHCCWFRLTNEFAPLCPGCRRPLSLRQNIIRSLDPPILALHHMRNDYPIGACSLTILNVVSFFKAQTPIPLTLFRHILEEDEVDAAAAKMFRASFLERVRVSGIHPCFSVEVKIQEIIRRSHGHKSGIEWGVELIQNEFGLLACEKDLELVEAMFPHAYTLWTHIMNDKDLAQDFLMFTNTILYSLDIHGCSHAALDFAVEALGIIRKIYGENTMETYNAIYNHAFTLMNVYRFDEAYDLLRIFPNSVQTTGYGHRHSAFIGTLFKAGSIMVYCLYQKGRIEESLHLCNTLIENLEVALEDGLIREYVCCHILSTLRYRNAKILTRLDRDDEAMAELKLALRSNRTRYTERSPKTILTKKQIAKIYIKKEQYESALQIYQSVGKIEKEILKKGHQNRLVTVRGMAACYNKMRQFPKSYRLCINTLIQFQELESPDNAVELIMVKRELGHALIGLKRYSIAIALFHEILELKKTLLGPQHPFILPSVRDLDKFKHFQTAH